MNEGPHLYEVPGSDAVLLLKLISKALEHINELCSDSLALLLWVFQALGRFQTVICRAKLPLAANALVRK